MPLIDYTSLTGQNSLSIEFLSYVKLLVGLIMGLITCWGKRGLRMITVAAACLYVQTPIIFPDSQLSVKEEGEAILTFKYMRLH